MTKIEVQKVEVQKMDTPRRNSIIGSATVLLGMAISQFAKADGGDLTQLTGTATSGVDTIKGAILTIAGVAVTIGLVWWAATKLKPKGG